MLKSFLNTIGNEWNIMMKEKMILIVILMIPIAVNFVFGVEFSNDQIRNIPMAVLDMDNSSLSRMVTQQFIENETFSVRYYPKNSDEMKRLLDESRARVGMIIPKDFGKEVKELKSPTVLMLYDGSHISLASTAKVKASEILMTLKAGTFIKLLEGKLNLPKDAAERMALSIKFTSRTLYNPAKSFKYFFNPGLATAIVQTGIALMTAVAIRREELQRSRKKRIGYVLGKAIFYSVLGTISFIICILIQNKVFDIPFRGSFIGAVVLSTALAIAVTVFGLFVSLVISNKLLATTVNAVLFIPNMIIVGYTWPYISLPKLYQIVAPCFPFYHYVNNLRNLFLAGEPLNFLIKDFEWFGIFISIILVLLIGAICLIKVEEPDEDIEIEEEGVYNGFSEITA
ncbi:MAG: ABC transporter permease [Clostridia bacterium]|nr:ABC transporter permease [Clostridia bacterium]